MSIWDEELGDAMRRGPHPGEQAVLLRGTARNGDEYRVDQVSVGSMDETLEMSIESTRFRWDPWMKHSEIANEEDRMRCEICIFFAGSKYNSRVFQLQNA
jgi:hypothetical protein